MVSENRATSAAAKTGETQMEKTRDQ